MNQHVQQEIYPDSEAGCGYGVVTLVLIFCTVSPSLPVTCSIWLPTDPGHIITHGDRTMYP